MDKHIKRGAAASLINRLMKRTGVKVGGGIVGAVVVAAGAYYGLNLGSDEAPPEPTAIVEPLNETSTPAIIDAGASDATEDQGSSVEGSTPSPATTPPIDAGPSDGTGPHKPGSAGATPVPATNETSTPELIEEPTWTPTPRPKESTSPISPSENATSTAEVITPVSSPVAASTSEPEASPTPVPSPASTSEPEASPTPVPSPASTPQPTATQLPTHSPTPTTEADPTWTPTPNADTSPASVTESETSTIEDSSAEQKQPIPTVEAGAQTPEPAVTAEPTSPVMVLVATPEPTFTATCKDGAIIVDGPYDPEKWYRIAIISDRGNPIQDVNPEWTGGWPFVWSKETLPDNPEPPAPPLKWQIQEENYLSRSFSKATLPDDYVSTIYEGACD